MLSEHGNPRLSSLVGILYALRLDLSEAGDIRERSGRARVNQSNSGVHTSVAEPRGNH